jgi:hypothetical protein
MKSRVLYRFLCWYDAYWRRRHSVEKFDALLSFSLETYAGERRIMNDGTWVAPGDRLMILHFNHECFVNSSANSKDYIRNALRFRKLLLSSLSQLAKDINANEKFVAVKAFHGVSWIPPHGEKLGFLIERLPNSARNKVRTFYFKILLKTFFPHITTSVKNPIQPHAYWLTRHNLLKNFSPEPSDGLLIHQQ